MHSCCSGKHEDDEKNEMWRIEPDLVKNCRCKGKHDDEKKEKRKYDAIEYYKVDLDWFISIFIFLGLNVTSILYYHFVYLPHATIYENQVDL